MQNTTLTSVAVPFGSLPEFSGAWLRIAQGLGTEDLFSRRAADLHACASSAEETLRMSRSLTDLAALLERSGREYGVPDSALARLSALAEGRAVFVVTGQQVGYLGGPLYTFLKAYHATRLATELESRLKRPVLPLFWLEGEDHDLEEVRHAHFLTDAHELGTLRFSPESGLAGYPVGRYDVDADVHVDELSQNLHNPSQEGLDLLRECYTETTLSGGLGRLLARTLGPRGLLVVEGMDENLKRMAAPLWERVLDRGRALSELLDKRSAELRQRECSAPLSPTPDACLFYLCDDAHVRVPLSYSGTWQHPGGAVETLSPEEIRARVRERPETVSPKAALRPLYQDFVLPTVAYIAGPTELDYHAQISPLYGELGVPAPVLFPRLSATPVDASTARSASKLGRSWNDLLGQSASTLARELAQEQDEGHTVEEFDATKKSIEVLYERLSGKLTALDPTLEGAARTSVGKSLHVLGQLREKAERALKQKHADVLKRLDRVLTAVRPRGQLSERVFCTGYYLTQFGPERLLAALDRLPVEAREHMVIEL